jgi:hypothetical protein
MDESSGCGEGRHGGECERGELKIKYERRSWIVE